MLVRLPRILMCRAHLGLMRWHRRKAEVILDRIEARKLALATRLRPSGPLIMGSVIRCTPD